jgi:Fe-S cluster biogenesis protein NfuA
VTEQEQTIESRVEAVLEKLRPYFESDGIDAIIDECEDSVVTLRVTTPPRACASHSVLTVLAIKHRILHDVKEVMEVRVLED